MNDLIRPTLYEAHHDIRPVKEPAAGRAAHRRRCGRAGLRDRRLSGARPRDGGTGAGRSARRDDGRRLRGRAGRHLQHPRAGAGSAGERRRMGAGAAAARRRRADRARPDAGLACGIGRAQCAASGRALWPKRNISARKLLRLLGVACLPRPNQANAGNGEAGERPAYRSPG